MRILLLLSLTLLPGLAAGARESVECGYSGLSGAEWQPVARLVRQEAAAGGYGDDFSAEFRCAWDGEKLFLEVKAVDDRLIPADRGLSWQNDVIELYFDYSGTDERQNQFHWFPLLAATGQPAFFSVADGREFAGGGFGLETEETPDGYRARLTIPLDFFLEEGGVRIADQCEIGFDLCVNNLKDESRQWIRHRFWSGDGSNWQHASANGRMRFAGPAAGVADSAGFRTAPASRYGMAVWPELSILTGHTRLRANRQSPYRDRYRPFDFGSLVTRLDEAAGPRSECRHWPLGASSPGEHLEDSRYLFHETFAGEERLTRVTSLLHPARVFKSNSDRIRLFVGASPGCWPQRAALPDGEIVTLSGEPLTAQFASGYLTVLFAPEDCDWSMPLLVYFSRPPLRAGLDASGALALDFGDRAEKTLALMPLYGTRLIPAGEIPDDLHTRARFWYRTLLEMPLDLRESFRVDPEQRRVEFRREYLYARRSDAFPGDEPLHLAPQSPLLGDSLPGTADLELPLNVGPYRAATGRGERIFSLTYPELERQAALPELEEMDGELLARINDGRLLDQLEAVVDGQARAEFPAPHVAPYWEWSRLYPFMTPENRERYRRLVRRALDGVVFAPENADRFYPRRSFEGRSRAFYRNLTEPYGCPEPFWNIGQVLAGLGEYAYYTGDYEVYEAHWPLIRDLAAIIHLGGFVHYRYDGGRTLAAAFEGLIRAAEVVGDREYRDETLAAYALYLATVSSFYRQSEWAVAQDLYSQLGEAPEAFADSILFITRQPLYTRMNSGLYSGGYGCAYDSTYLVNPRVLVRAEAEIRRIEEVELPRCRADWTRLAEWEWPEALINRFGVRALLLREPPEKIERYYRELMDNPRLAQDAFVAARLAGLYLEYKETSE